MKRSIVLLVLLTLTHIGVCDIQSVLLHCPYGDEVNPDDFPFEPRIQIEIIRDQYPAISDLKYFRSLLPESTEWFNNAIIVSRWGQNSFFTVNINFWPVYIGCIVSYEIITPNGITIPLVPDDMASAEDKIQISKSSYVFEYFKELFPSGVYTVRAVIDNGSIIKENTFTVPPYESDFLPIEATTYWENNRLKMQFSSTADANQPYKIDVNNNKTFQEIWSQTTTLTYPEAATFDFDALIQKGKGSYEIYAEAKMFYYDAKTDITLVSAKHWLITPRTLAPIEDKITKCTVALGKDNTDSIVIKGQIRAIEADFYNANAMYIGLASESLCLPLSLTLPVDLSMFKTGRFITSYYNGAVRFCYDPRTHAFSLVAKGLDLSGLACPMTLTIQVGDYYAATLELFEPVVNGTKPCPPQLLMGIKDTLILTKHKVAHGKTAGTDTLTAQGYFTVENLFDENGQFILNVAGQTFTVPYSRFKFKNGVYSCVNAAAAEGGLLTARFDTNRAAFTLSIKKATLPKAGQTDFNLNLFGCDLSGLSQIHTGF